MTHYDVIEQRQALWSTLTARGVKYFLLVKVSNGALSAFLDYTPVSAQASSQIGRPDHIGQGGDTK